MGFFNGKNLMSEIKKVFKIIFRRKIIASLGLLILLYGIRISDRLIIHSYVKGRGAVVSELKLLLIVFVALYVCWYFIYMGMIKTTFKDMRQEQQLQYAKKIEEYIALKEEMVYMDEVFLYDSSYCLGIVPVRYSQIKKVAVKHIKDGKTRITYYTRSGASTIFKNVMERENALNHAILLKSHNEDIVVTFS